jgi:hypothetical protein
VCKALPGVFEGKTPLQFNSLAEKGLTDESVRLALRGAIAVNEDPLPASIEGGLRLEIRQNGWTSHSHPSDVDYARRIVVFPSSTEPQWDD